MMALAMVVVASLVAAGGLGEDVLKAIGQLKVGESLLAGIAIVFLAIIIDRITQGDCASPGTRRLRDSTASHCCEVANLLKP